MTEGRRTLTKNEALVFGALRKSDQPMSAYALLDNLRDDGLRAPVQVYRALDRLVEFGMAHRLESLNAFVACNHPDCDDSGQTAFAICDSCGKVTEFTDPALETRLADWANQASFVPNRTTVELRGHCADCSGRP
ncbi:MAG: Fur family transcriptional regulator [Alphaproteobacteria bacterium]|uniref:Fur family transcriptional regulator n=1 Tax=Pacificispira sp. TaxID=2888761 RepID=UPI0032FB2D81